MVADAMARAELEFSALKRVGVTLGPGSFTGVRVGLAFAKGLSLALNIPCIGVGSLEALAASSDPGPVVAVIDARHGQLYVQAFDGGAALAPPRVLSLSEAADLVRIAFGSRNPRFVGPGAPALAEQFEGAALDPLAAPEPLAIARLTRLATSPDGRPRPIYLRPPDARTLAERNA